MSHQKRTRLRKKTRNANLCPPFGCDFIHSLWFQAVSNCFHITSNVIWLVWEIHIKGFTNAQHDLYARKKKRLLWGRNVCDWLQPGSILQKGLFCENQSCQNSLKNIMMESVYLLKTLQTFEAIAWKRTSPLELITGFSILCNETCIKALEYLKWVFCVDMEEFCLHLLCSNLASLVLNR